MTAVNFDNYHGFLPLYHSRKVFQKNLPSKYIFPISIQSCVGNNMQPYPWMMKRKI